MTDGPASVTSCVRGAPAVDDAARAILVGGLRHLLYGAPKPPDLCACCGHRLRRLGEPRLRGLGQEVAADDEGCDHPQNDDGGADGVRDARALERPHEWAEEQIEQQPEGDRNEERAREIQCVEERDDEQQRGGEGSHGGLCFHRALELLDVRGLHLAWRCGRSGAFVALAIGVDLSCGEGSSHSSNLCTFAASGLGRLEHCGRARSRSGRRLIAIFPSVTAPDPSPKDDEQAAALKLWVILSRARDAIGELAKLDVERSELSLTEFAVMEALFHKGDLTAGEVSRRVLLRSGSLTYVIDKLVDRGLLKRRVCDEDKRRTYLQLTGAGNALMRRIWPGHAAAIEAAMSGLTLAEKRTAARLLKKMGLEAELAKRREPNGDEIS